MKAANKPALADAIWELIPHDVQVPPQQDYTSPWQTGSTYESIFRMYANYILLHYGGSLVFDGYEFGPSTKDNSH